VTLEAETTPQPVNPPGPATKVIHVTSVPPGATIQMDGQAAGQTPADLKVADQKTHEIVLKLEGHQDVTQTIDHSSNNNVNIVLQAVALPGYLKFSGSGRIVVLSGSKVLKGNPIELEPGTHKLTFRSGKDAYIHFTKTVEIKAGETTVVRGPEMGKITIKAVPSNCKISINGEFIDEAPILNLPIQEGNHSITFNWETLGKKQTKTVSIDAGASQTVTGIPEKDD